VFLGWRRARSALLAAAVVPALIEHRERRPDLGVAAFTVLRLADDLAYGAGVWAGCIARRDLTALLPAFAGRFAPRALHRERPPRAWGVAPHRSSNDKDSVGAHHDELVGGGLGAPDLAGSSVELADFTRIAG